MHSQGVLMRNTDNARALLLASMDEQRWSTDWRFKFGYEQSAMWELLRPVNSTWRNVVHVSTSDHTLQGFCGFIHVFLVLYGHCLWQPGDFLAHFAPPYSPAGHIARFMKEHSQCECNCNGRDRSTEIILVRPEQIMSTQLCMHLVR